MNATQNNNYLLEQFQVKSFLESLGMKSPIASTQNARFLFDNLVVTEMDEAAGRWFNAKNGKLVLLSCIDKDEWHPVSLFFLTEAEKFSFGHASLLSPSYHERPELMQMIARSTQKLFSLQASDLLSRLCPEWAQEPFEMMVDKRILWMEPNIPSVVELLKSRFQKLPSLPLFPTVFAFNNPYLGKLIEVAREDVLRGLKVLSMGCGAGIEAAYFALKNGTEIDAVDINPIAVANTRAIAQQLGVGHLVNTWTSDGFAQVSGGYDVILLNAPLAVHEKRENDVNRFDPKGSFLKMIMDGLHRALAPEGKLIVMSHPDLKPYLSEGFDFQTRESFEVKVPLAISEVFRKDEKLSPLFS